MSDEVFTESTVEQADQAWSEGLGCAVMIGPDVARDGATPEHASYTNVTLRHRLRQALAALDRTHRAPPGDRTTACPFASGGSRGRTWRRKP